MISPLSARPAPQPLPFQGAKKAAAPLTRQHNPKFGGVETAAIVWPMVSAVVAMHGSIVLLILKQRAWDKALQAVKTEYDALENKDREGFLKALPKRPEYQKNPSMEWWHKYTTRAEKAQRVHEARQEIERLNDRMQKYSIAHPKMPEMLKYFHDLKKNTQEHPENYTNPDIVNSWACYMEALHMVTMAKDKRAMKFDEGQKWFRIIDQRWDRTPILETPAQALSFQSIADTLDEIIKEHGRSLTEEERMEELKETLRELVNEGLFSKADMDLLVKMSDEGLLSQEDASAVDAVALRDGRALTEEEAGDVLDFIDIVTHMPKEENPDDEALRQGLRNAGAVIGLRRELGTATADDFQPREK